MFFPKYFLFDRMKKAVSGIKQIFFLFKWKLSLSAKATQYQKQNINFAGLSLKVVDETEKFRI
jgi:hypothetical protein